MLKCKACKDTFVANLIIILKFVYLSTILTPPEAPEAGGRGKLPYLSRLLLQSIAISLSRFFHFEIILLEVTLIYLFTYLHLYLSSGLQDNVEGNKQRATIRRAPRPAIEITKILVMGMKAWNLDVFLHYCVSALIFDHCPAQTLILQS